MISSIPSMHANTVAPFVPLGRQAVGQESTELKSSTFKPLEQPADSARSENKRNPNASADQGAAASNNRAVNDKQDNPRDKERKQKEQQQVDELAAIDRAVHAHEAAHAAAAGEFAGTTSYTYTKGPNGVSYATGGEVSIDSSPVPNNPEATIRKAQQIRQAANAPADPSSQDRKVAAQAAQMEIQARVELALQQVEERKLKASAAASETDAQKVLDTDEAKKAEAKKALEKTEDEKLAADQAQREADRRAIFDRVNKSTRRATQKLLEINSIQGYSSVGNFISSKV